MGTLGYPLLINEPLYYFDAFYMTTITISSVGFEEVVNLAPYPLARAFTIVLIGLGMGNLLFVFSFLTSKFVEGDVEIFIRRYKLKQIIRSAKEFYIVCGIGKSGLYAAEELIKMKKKEKYLLGLLLKSRL